MGFDRSALAEIHQNTGHLGLAVAMATPSRARSASREPAAGSARGPMVVTIPGLRLVNALNVREHPMSRHRRVKRERATVGMHLLSLGRDRPAPPLTVRMVRVYPPRGKAMDFDGLHAACKGARDAVAEWLGIDDAERFGVTWDVAQEPGAAWAVRIEVAPAGAAAGGGKGNQ